MEILSNVCEVCSEPVYYEEGTLCLKDATPVKVYPTVDESGEVSPPVQPVNYAPPVRHVSCAQ